MTPFGIVFVPSQTWIDEKTVTTSPLTRLGVTLHIPLQQGPFADRVVVTSAGRMPSVAWNKPGLDGLPLWWGGDSAPTPIIYEGWDRFRRVVRNRAWLAQCDGLDTNAHGVWASSHNLLRRDEPTVSEILEATRLAEELGVGRTVVYDLKDGYLALREG